MRPLATLLVAFGALCAQTLDPALFKELRYRHIGPFRGGRVTAVAGVPSQPNVYYFGATGGGIWKSTDAGDNWEAVSDNGPFGTGSVGAIAVSDSDPNTVYAGMGEVPIRGNVSHGDGMYKSMDAGKTWKRLGLEDTRQISRIRVHPKNPDVLYVCALGHVWGPSEQRGVFRSTDGGANWKQVATRGPKAGCIDLAMDPSNARVLYAGFWEVYRKPWTLESGGPGSGILKSTDGGDTWTDLTRKPGLPKGLIGKIGITVSPVNPERLWAIVEAEDGGVFRSENGGANWTRVNQERQLRQRAWYYTRIYADTQKADTVYVLNVGFHRSNDGGMRFTTVPTPHSDNHDLWIAPGDSNRMIESNDGGANVTNNAGRTWTAQDQPTAQFYRVALDNDFPYNIYGAQQDNSTVRIASRGRGPGIDVRDWYDVGGGESGWIAPHPKNSEVVFAGSYGGLLTRYDHGAGQQRNVTVWPDNPMGHGAADLKYRFQWNFPILFSPHDANTLYAGGNVLFKSNNEGQNWTAISGDLTRNDKSKMGPSGGPITKDNTSVEYYGTIFTVAESPVKANVIWTGSDDGLVHVTRDGKTWTNVTPKGMPEWIQINSVEASPHDAGRAFLAATMYKWDDNRPYLYRTDDYGQTWKQIDKGIPDTAFTRVIREDPARKGLLYAGTETGMYVSFDDGENWQRFQLNLPVVPITDLAIQSRGKDLVVATQGRSFWVLDDLPVLHQLRDEALAGVHLFKPEDAWRTPGGGSRLRGPVTVGQNPPSGAVIWYYLKDKPQSEVTLEILDKSGKLVQKFTSKEAPGPAQPESGAPAEESGSSVSAPPARAPAEKGLNRFVWNLHYPSAEGFPGLILWAGSLRGPVAVPGDYQVRLTAGGQSLTQTFSVRKDPRLATSAQDFEKQFALLTQIRDKLTETHEAIVQIRDARKQVTEAGERAGEANKPVAEAAKALAKQLTDVEEALYQTKNQSSQDPLNYPIRLNNKLAALAGVVSASDDAPIAQSYVVYEQLVSAINIQLHELRGLLYKEVPEFNRLVREKNVPAVNVKKPVGR